MTHPLAGRGSSMRDGDVAGHWSVDLRAIVANWRELARRAETAECAAVVKADAYGCGVRPVAEALSNAGCRTFFVAYGAEGREVRNAAPNAVIYVLNGLIAAPPDACAASNLRPVLSTMDDIAQWEAFGRASGWKGGAALQMDTGMNRLGLTPSEAEALSRRQSADRAGVSLLMSHFACADEPAHPLNARQIGAFAALRRMFPGTPASLANSSGIFLGPDAHHEVVRPGIALYGGNPTPGRLNPMRPVVRLAGRIVQVRAVEKGETVGYGARWTAKRDSKIAIVSLGYADGYLRAASASDEHAGAQASIGGRRCPLAGRVSMDLLAVDVTDLPEGIARRGELASLLDEEIGIDEVAAHAGTIAYEVLTRLGPRFPRTYLAAQSAPAPAGAGAV